MVAPYSKSTKLPKYNALLAEFSAMSDSFLSIPQAPMYIGVEG